ncbi:MAG: hypothetical protein KAU23_06135 [Anaerolineales bacterium]|nr:hypothetical protein [Anaerolineales bacterium]
MTISAELFLALRIGCGICWTITYLLIIKRGFQDQTYGMPIAALGANISWEFIFAFVHPQSIHPQLIPQIYITITWFLLDVIILYQVFLFGKKTINDSYPEVLFYPAILLAILVSFVLILAISIEFDDWNGRYAAFGQNLMMSILFVVMFFKRKDLSGQSVYIALFKMMGTVIASILIFSLKPESVLLNTLYFGILFFDILYTILLFNKSTEMGINPWKLST